MPVLSCKPQSNDPLYSNAELAALPPKTSSRFYEYSSTNGKPRLRAHSFLADDKEREVERVLNEVAIRMSSLFNVDTSSHHIISLCLSVVCTLIACASDPTLGHILEPCFRLACSHLAWSLRQGTHCRNSRVLV